MSEDLSKKRQPLCPRCNSHAFVLGTKSGKKTYCPVCKYTATPEVWAAEAEAKTQALQGEIQPIAETQGAVSMEQARAYLERLGIRNADESLISDDQVIEVFGLVLDLMATAYEQSQFMLSSMIYAHTELGTLLDKIGLEIGPSIEEKTDV